MALDWWLGRTPAQQARKADRAAKFAADRQRRRDRLAERRRELTARDPAAAASPVDEETRLRTRLDRIYRLENAFLSIELVLLVFALVGAVLLGVAVFIIFTV